MDRKYSVIYKESTKAESATYRHPDVVKEEELPWRPFPNLNSIGEVFKQSAEKYANEKFLAARNPANGNKYEYETYGQIYQKCKALGSGMKNLNLAPPVPEGFLGKNIKFVGIMAKNRPEWMTLDLANILYGQAMVPFYDVYKADVIEHVLNKTEMATIFTTEDCLPKFYDLKERYNLKTIVTIDPMSEETRKKITDAGYTAYSWQEVIESGKANPRGTVESQPDDIFTLCFTSGTTGMPKGCMLSNKMMMSFMLTIMTINGADLEAPHVGDVVLSFLPLTHVYQRYIELTLMACGAAVAYYQGDILKVKDDLMDSKPTLFCGVPRLYNRFYSKVQDQVKTMKGVKGWLVNKAIAAKTSHLTLDTPYYTSIIYDPIVFNKMKAALGGNVRVMFTGSAPIDSKVFDFLRIMACAPMQEGYGQTESGGASFVTKMHEKTRGHVGGPTKSLEFKLEDIPDMNYTAKDVDENGKSCPRGEICMRGPSIFKNYYKDQEKTNDTIDANEWLHTGDVGVILPDGALKIIDRKKNLFKLCQGEYVAPEKIENVYGRALGVAEIFVEGRSTEDHVIAIVVPSWEAMEVVAKEKGIDVNKDNFHENAEINKFILDNMLKAGKDGGLSKLEQIKKVYLEKDSFQGRCLTPTFKLQRHLARQIFDAQITELYK